MLLALLCREEEWWCLRCCCCCWPLLPPFRLSAGLDGRSPSAAAAEALPGVGPRLCFLCDEESDFPAAETALLLPLPPLVAAAAAPPPSLLLLLLPPLLSATATEPEMTNELRWSEMQTILARSSCIVLSSVS